MITKPTRTATRAEMPKRIGVRISVARRIKGQLLGRNRHLTLFCPTPDRLHLTRRTRVTANQRPRRSAALSIHVVATVRASPVDRLRKAARTTDPATGHRKVTLVVSLQLVRMRQAWYLRGRVLAVHGISDVERERNPRICLARHLLLGRAIHFTLQRMRRLRTPPMQATLPLDRPQHLAVGTLPLVFELA